MHGQVRAVSRIAAFLITIRAGSAPQAVPVVAMFLTTGWVSDVAYNATTDTFTENGAGLPSRLTNVSGATENFASDMLITTYDLTANVDNLGVTHGGAGSVIGESV